jgi:type I restriction enzyme, S subunit
MKHWPTKPLADVYWFQEGPGVRKWQFRNNGIKLLNVANITKRGLLDLSKTDRYLSKEEVSEKYSHFLADDGDLVIASSGISFDDDGLLRTRGAFVESRHLPLCINTSTIRFKPKAGVSTLAWLRYWLDSREFREQITRLVTGSAQQNFGPAHLKATKISLPPLTEQERIVKVLDEADELRKLRAQADRRTGNLIPAVFHEMFGELASNPNNWELVRLVDVISKEKHSIKRGPFGGAIKKEIFVPDGYKIYEQKNAIRSDFEIGSYFIDETKFKELEAFSVSPDDLIISCSGTMGKVAIVPKNAKPGIINQALLKLRLDQTKALPIFFKHLLETDFLQRLIFGGAAGSAIKNVMPLAQIKKTQFPLPPIQRQKEFVQRVAEIRELEAKQAMSRNRLNSLFQSVLHLAFNSGL